MIKLVFLCLCLRLHGILSAPIQSFEVLDDLNNEAEIIDAAERLPGINNLYEKRLPVIRLAIPGHYIGLYGTSNLGERIQVQQYYDQLPGMMNLKEKAIPEAVISEMSVSRHPKSEVEKIKVNV